MVETPLADDASVRRPPSPRGQRAGGPQAPEGITRIGRGVVIEGDVKGGEDLVIDGKVDGTIELRHHVLTVGPTGRVKVQLSAKSVVVLGKVSGSIRASERVSIGETGSVEGAISAPRLVVADGAHVQGRVDEACFLRYSQGDAWTVHSLNTAKGTRLGVFIQGPDRRQCGGGR